MNVVRAAVLHRAGDLIRALPGVAVILLLVTTPALSQNESYNFAVEEAGSQALLTLSTVDGLPCAGYTIRTSAHWDADTAIVVLLGLVAPTPCIHGFDVATGEVLLRRNGRTHFFLRISEGASSDLWTVTMSLKGILAKPIHADFTSYAP